MAARWNFAQAQQSCHTQWFGPEIKDGKSCAGIALRRGSDASGAVKLHQRRTNSPKYLTISSAQLSEKFCCCVPTINSLFLVTKRAVFVAVENNICVETFSALFQLFLEILIAFFITNTRLQRENFSFFRVQV